MLLKFILFFYIIFFSNSLLAQLPGIDKKILTLDDCLKIASQNNFDLLLARESINQADAQLTSAFGAYLPDLGINGGYTRRLTNLNQFIIVGDRTIDASVNPNAYRLNMGASMTIFDGFSREFNYDRANLDLQAAQLNATQSLREIKLLIYQRFVNVIRNKQIYIIRQENLKQGEAELERIKALFDAGVISIVNVYSQQSDLGNREFDLLNAEAQLFNSKAELLRVMGLEPDIDVDFDEKSVPNTTDELNLDKIDNEIKSYVYKTSSILEKRLDYQTSLLNYESSKDNVGIARGSYFPRVFASGGWAWANNELTKFNDFGNASFGLSFTIPLFSQFRVDASVQNAEIQEIQANINLQRKEQEVRTDVRVAQIKIETSRKQLEVADKALAFAEMNYESSRERFQVGDANIIEFQAANNQLINAQINKINAVYNYYQAKKEIEFALGIEN